MVKVRDKNSRLEEYRENLKSCLENMLLKCDDIIDFCYVETVSSIDINIHLSPETEIPSVSYTANTIVRG